MGNYFKTLLAALLVLISVTEQCYSQTPDWLWAFNAGDNGTCEAMGTATDTHGNVYVAGSWWNFNYTYFGQFTLSNHGSDDVFLVKFDANGNLLWATSAGGKSDDECMGVATDRNGNVFITGYFKSDSITFGNTTLVNSGGSNTSDSTEVFLAKYDSSGNVLWAKSAGGTGYDYSSAVTTDNTGNAYITGAYSDTISFGSIKSDSSVFLAKYNPAGDVLWVIAAGGYMLDFGSSITTDRWNNVYASTGRGIIKYDSSGNYVCSSPAVLAINSIAVDSQGNFYGTGYYSGQPLFGTDTFAQGSNSVFLIKCDPNGNPLWAITNNDFNSDADAYGIAVDAAGNIYFGGFFGGTYLTLGNIKLLNNDNFNDFTMFVAKVNSQGNLQWAIIPAMGNSDMGFSGNEKCYSLSAYGNSLYAAGYFSGPSAVFGNDTLNLPNGSSANMFVAKLDGQISTNVKKVDDKNSFLVFPNPSDGRSTISNSMQDIKRVTIYNLPGEPVIDEEFTVPSSNLFTIDLSSCSKGIYFCHITMADRTVRIEKIIVQ